MQKYIFIGKKQVHVVYHNIVQEITFKHMLKSFCDIYNMVTSWRWSVVPVTSSNLSWNTHVDRVANNANR